jgi:RNA polymerase sigma factor FliA
MDMATKASIRKTKAKGDDQARESLVAEDESTLWKRWGQDRVENVREQLICHYLPYARIVAASYYALRHHDEIEFAEYLQLASVGLVESIDRFDPGIGVQFKTFAAQRMRGAILNGLEHLTEKQQQIAMRQRLRKERLQSVKDCAASTARVESDQLFRHLADVGIGLALSYLLEGTGMIDVPQAVSDSNYYYQGIELRQLQKRVKTLVHDLPEQEQTVIRYHYLQEIPFEQIAVMLNLTKGRIAQIHHKSLRRLAEMIKDSQSCDVAW